MKVVVVGAGVIGAVTGYRLARAGADVTVVEAGCPASAASGASFGWINASFHENADHFRLRAAAMEAHHRLQCDLGTGATSWPGCLCWEDSGEAFDRRHATLAGLGYAVEVLEAAGFARLEPRVPPPARALRFRDEGAVDLPTLTRDALAAAADLGLRLICGVEVTGLVTRGGRVRGVATQTGTIAADRVVLAAGTGTTQLLEGVGVPLPMLHRPGLILRSRAMPKLLDHILVAPAQEVRQLPDGCLLAPTAAAHQHIDDDAPVHGPEELAAAAAARLSVLLGTRVDWARVTLAHRPVPGDGLPAIGPCGPAGLYVATLHSGATLAPLVAELVAAEVVGKNAADTVLLSPYRPDRFRA